MITYSEIKKQLKPGWIVQLGNGKQARYFSLNELRKVCFRQTKRWDFDPLEVKAYHPGTSITKPFVVPKE